MTEGELQAEFADDDGGRGGEMKMRGDEAGTEDVGLAHQAGAAHQSLPQPLHTALLQAGDQLQ